MKNIFITLLLLSVIGVQAQGYYHGKKTFPSDSWTYNGFVTLAGTVTNGAQLIYPNFQVANDAVTQLTIQGRYSPLIVDGIPDDISPDLTIHHVQIVTNNNGIITLGPLLLHDVRGTGLYGATLSTNVGYEWMVINQTNLALCYIGDGERPYGGFIWHRVE